MHFFSLPSGYVLVGTSGFTDGCVLMYHLFSLPAGSMQQRLVSFHVVLMKDYLVSILIVFVGASVLTPGWVYVGVSGFTPPPPPRYGLEGTSVFTHGCVLI